MAKKLSLESLTKKLKNVVNTQDSIPMFSLWIIHHKAHHELIVNTWLEILKNSKPKHRLTLWYLANDVIQSCHRKKADIFKESFANVLPEAIAFLRDKSILSGVERVLNVWSSRNIFDTEVIDQLHAALLTNRPPDKLRQKLLAEYKPVMLVDSITSFKKREDTVVFEEKHLKNIRMDASSSDDIHKLKDKVGGEKFSKNFEESAIHMERFIKEYESYIEERKNLIERLAQGAVFYRAQYHEAKIVVNAYQSFDTRVRKMKRLIDQLKLKLLPQPPVADTRKCGLADDADMDMSDSDQELGSKPSKILTVDTNVLRPVQQTRNIENIKLPVSKQNTLANVNKPTQMTDQHNPVVINRPGMRGASTAVQILSSGQNFSKTAPNLDLHVVFDGHLSSDILSKNSPCSGSPPSPVSSPELNISSPPRHQSLESRLADLFNGNNKVNLAINTENTGSESDPESIPPVARAASPVPANSAVEAKEAEATRNPSDIGSIFSVAKMSPLTLSTTLGEQQNTIPVIGGHRNATSSQKRTMGENLRLILDGSSTPLQDERNSETEMYFDRAKSEQSSLLPPPSFSGDALNFLTKFMGQKTNTVLVQLESAEKQYDAEGKVLAEHSDAHRLNVSETNDNRLKQDGGASKELDTDYRMSKGESQFSENSKGGFCSVVQPGGEFENIDQAGIKHFKTFEETKTEETFTNVGGLNRKPEDEATATTASRIKSSDKNPVLAKGPAARSSKEKEVILSGRTNEDLIVEEEEIELDDDTNADTVRSTSSYEPRHDNAAALEHKEFFESSRPVHPPSPNHVRLRRGYTGPTFRDRNSPRFDNGLRQHFQHGQMAQSHRMSVHSSPAAKRSFNGRISGTVENIQPRPISMRPRDQWGSSGKHSDYLSQRSTSLNDEYYDMLYDQLQPEFYTDRQHETHSRRVPHH